MWEISPSLRRRAPRAFSQTAHESGYGFAGAILGVPQPMTVVGGGAGETLRSRVRAEFIEMPGLQLTFEQATRLWGLEPKVCQALIDDLVSCGFLRRTANGRVARAERQ
jgi:hypothetical protein